MKQASFNSLDKWQKSSFEQRLCQGRWLLIHHSLPLPVYTWLKQSCSQNMNLQCRGQWVTQYNEAESNSDCKEAFVNSPIIYVLISASTPFPHAAHLHMTMDLLMSQDLSKSKQTLLKGYKEELCVCAPSVLRQHEGNRNLKLTA